MLCEYFFEIYGYFCILVPYSAFDCVFMIVSFENHKMTLASITFWFTSKERLL